MGAASGVALVATRVVEGCGNSLRSPDTHEGTTDTLCTPIVVEPTWVVPVCTIASPGASSNRFVEYEVNLFTELGPVIVAVRGTTVEWVSVTAW